MRFLLPTLSAPHFHQRTVTASIRIQQGQAVFIMLIGLFLASMIGLLVHNSMRTFGNHDRIQAQTSLQSLQIAREALLGYAVTYRETHPDEGYGYLPCPDLTGNGEAAATCGAAGTFALGLLPYKTLGLPDLRDGHGECLWYAVSGRFKNNPKANLLNWDALGELDISDAGGQQRLSTSRDARGGAIAVVFSPGQSLNEGASARVASSYPCRANPQQAELYLETTRPPFHQSTSDQKTNDQLLWLTSADIFSRLRLRKDFPAYINTGVRSLQSALSFNQSRYPPVSGALIPSTIVNTLSVRDVRYHMQWQDQFAYLSCAASGSYCYVLGGQQCDGALVFSGEHVTGRPRVGATRAYADYFESALGLVAGLSTDVPQLAANYSVNSLVARSQDIVRCLSPKTQTLSSASLSQNPLTVGNAIAAPENSANEPWLKFGQSGTTSIGAGCAWFPEPLLFGASDVPMHLRVYFTFTIASASQGFTLTLADADTNNRPRMCGKGGAFLGYAGSDIGIAPVNAPKLALEFDTQCNGMAFGETPCTSPWQQLSFVQWGNDDGLNDDNRHGIGNNPPLGGIAERHGLSFLGTQQHARLEMIRRYDERTGISRHTLNAWLARDITQCPELHDISADMHELQTRNPDCPMPLISTVQNVPRTIGSGIPFKQAWIGLTAGQEGTAQLILIHKFVAEVGVQ